MTQCHLCRYYQGSTACSWISQKLPPTTLQSERKRLTILAADSDCPGFQELSIEEAVIRFCRGRGGGAEAWKRERDIAPLFAWGGKLEDRSELFSLFVRGVPRPQGSKRHVGHGIMIESSKYLKPWREKVAWSAKDTMKGRAPLSCAIFIQLEFVLPRPKSHWRKKGLSSRAPAKHVSRPDLDKLIRAILDALTGVLMSDDSQVVRIDATKRYGAREEDTGVHIRGLTG